MIHLCGIAPIHDERFETQLPDYRPLVVSDVSSQFGEFIYYRIVGPYSHVLISTWKTSRRFRSIDVVLYGKDFLEVDSPELSQVRLGIPLLDSAEDDKATGPLNTVTISTAFDIGFAKSQVLLILGGYTDSTEISVRLDSIHFLFDVHKNLRIVSLPTNQAFVDHLRKNASVAISGKGIRVKV